MPTIAMKTYLVKMHGEGKQKVTVPASWKVTFGPIVPGSKGSSGYNGSAGLCLRFYEGKDQQRACFANVEWFRDTSITIMEERTQTKQETFYKDGNDGREQVVMEANVKEWVNPDAPSQGARESFAKLKGPKTAA